MLFVLLKTAVVSGFLLGTVYALIGAGLNVIYGVMRVVNYAHGDMLILASYFAFWMHRLYGLDPLRSLFLAVPVFFILGIITYLPLVPRLLRSDDPETASFLAFFGISLMLVSGMNLVWGADPRSIPYPYQAWMSPFTTIGDIFLPSSRFIAGGVSVIVMVVLLVVLYRTYYGKALRAIIQNRDAARLLGIDTHKISAFAFGMGLALVAVAGVLVSLIFPSIAPHAGAPYTIIAFSVMVLGGLGHPVGALIGGMIFGIVESVATVFLPIGLTPVVAFGTLIVVVMVKPDGLLTGVNSDRLRTWLAGIFAPRSVAARGGEETDARG